MNRHPWRIVVVAAVLAVIQGCALKPQFIHLDPAVNISSTQVANGTLIGLSVTDARDTKKLGEVGDPNNKMVEVSLTEDFTPLLYKKIAEKLTEKGFEVVPSSDAMLRALNISVKRLELSSVKTPFNFKTELRAEIGASAHNEKETYDRLFYVRTYKETAGPPYQKDSNALVNSAVSQALDDMLSDEKLQQLLAH